MPIATLNAVKILPHARCELTDDVVCKMKRLTKAGMDLSILKLTNIIQEEASTDAHIFLLELIAPRTFLILMDARLAVLLYFLLVVSELCGVSTALRWLSRYVSPWQLNFEV